MNAHRELVAAIESFDRWEQPWQFFETVLSFPSLDTAARDELERIWATAGETAAWSSCKDLSHGCMLAEARLLTSYPWLNAKARRQLVNGAAYQWR